MKIVSLTAENIKRLVAVQIDPKGNVIQITGKNGNGKSSVLDSIYMALGGKNAIPEKPVRDGQEKGSIKVELDDLIITRRFTQRGSTLQVENKDGAVFKSPQKMLDELIGRLSFDPMAFMREKPAKQFEILAEQAGIDFQEIDAKRKKAFDERTVVNRQGKAKAAEVEAIHVPMDAPDEVISSADLLKKIADTNEHNQKIASLDTEITGQETTIKDLQEERQGLINELKQLDASIGSAEEELYKMRDERSSLLIYDVEPLKQQLEGLETSNEAARSARHFERENKVLEELREQSQNLTQAIEDCDAERSDMIKKADLPVPGLSFGDGFVTYNDVPLDQASSAEQLRVSAAVAMAMNPKLRVIRIQDGSLLDSESMAIIEDMAKSEDYQFWIERVDESGKVGIVIEDGQIVANNQEQDNEEV